MNINNQTPNENTDSVNINRSNNATNKNSSNPISSNLTRTSNYINNLQENYKDQGKCCYSFKSFL